MGLAYTAPQLGANMFALIQTLCLSLTNTTAVLVTMPGFATTTATMKTTNSPLPRLVLVLQYLCDAGCQVVL